MNTCIILADNVRTEITETVWGKVSVHYNVMKDALSIQIDNRALNSEPFRITLYSFSKEALNGTSSYTIAHTVLDDYRRYVNRYIWR